MRDAVRKELDRICKLLPQNPPEEVAERIRERGFLSKDALVYKAVKVKCSRCGEEAYLEYLPIANQYCHGYGGCPDSYGFRDITTGELVKSGDTATCPSCFNNCMAIGAARIGNKQSYEIDNDYVLTIHNVEGYLTCLGWKIHKCVRKDGGIVYGALKMQGVSVIGKTVVRFVGCQHNYSNAVTFFERWHPRYTYGDDKLSSFDRMPVFIDTPE